MASLEPDSPLKSLKESIDEQQERVRDCISNLSAEGNPGPGHIWTKLTKTPSESSANTTELKHKVENVKKLALDAVNKLDKVDKQLQEAADRAFSTSAESSQSASPAIDARSYGNSAFVNAGAMNNSGQTNFGAIQGNQYNRT